MMAEGMISLKKKDIKEIQENFILVILVLVPVSHKNARIEMNEVTFSIR